MTIGRNEVARDRRQGLHPKRAPASASSGRRRPSRSGRRRTQQPGLRRRQEDRSASVPANSEFVERFTRQYAQSRRCGPQPAMAFEPRCCARLAQCLYSELISKRSRPRFAASANSRRAKTVPPLYERLSMSSPRAPPCASSRPTLARANQSPTCCSPLSSSCSRPTPRTLARFIPRSAAALRRQRLTRRPPSSSSALLTAGCLSRCWDNAWCRRTRCAAPPACSRLRDVGDQTGQRLALIEIGPSAGLNLLFDSTDTATAARRHR